MNELSLFTGAGGGLLGTHLLGWKPCGYVEWNSYCQQVIAARIRDGYLPVSPIFTDVREFVKSGAAEKYQGIADVVTAGFPCQPFSVAGKQAGADDERNMWPATRDVIRIVRPSHVLLENVPGLVSCGYIGTVLCDLASLGYVFRWGVLGARDVGAPHKRDRLWIVANAESESCDGVIYNSRVCIEPCEVSKLRNGCGAAYLANASGGRCGQSGARQVQQSGRAKAVCSSEAVANADPSGQQEQHASAIAREQGPPSWASSCWWLCDPGDDPESGVGRVAYGVAHRLDRLKATGNGQVSSVVERAWKELAA